MASGNLRLRAPSESDVGWITRACQDSDIQRWTRIPVPYSEADARYFVTVGVGSLRSWVIVGDGTDIGLGTVAIHYVDDHGCAESGYWVAPWARRQGVATWALNEICRRAREIDGINSVTLTIAVENIASCRTAERSGFVIDPTITHTAPEHGVDVPALRYLRAV